MPYAEENTSLSVVPELSALTVSEQALVEVGEWLQEQHYEFTTITPESHYRVNNRPENLKANNLRDIFGWSRPFSTDLLPEGIIQLLEQAKVLIYDGDYCFSRVRFSTLKGLLIAHSSFPTTESQSVFFGPDTYRFASWVEAQLGNSPTPFKSSHYRILDLGCGSGAIGLLVAKYLSSKHDVELVLSDVNPETLAFSRINAELAGIENVETIESDLFENLTGSFDLILANPPYLLDTEYRVYRHGGGQFGEGVALSMVAESLPRLTLDGQLLLYTGSAFIDGKDSFYQQALPLLDLKKFDFSYQEIDPDVFGKELEKPGMRKVERIAAVGLNVERSLLKNMPHWRKHDSLS